MRRSLLLLVGLAIVLTGCQTQTGRWPWQKTPPPPPDLYEDGPVSDAPPANDTGLPISPSQRFPDIPLPADIKPDVRATYVFQSADFRIGRMVYTTRSLPNDVGQFYIRECPAAQWELQTVVEDSSGKQLQFKKGGEQLLVKIHEIGMGRRELELHLTPDAPP